MTKIKNYTVIKNAKELTEMLGLDPEEAIHMEFRANIIGKIINATKLLGLTHHQIAKKTGASRTRITAILNGHAKGMSTDLLLRILYALGYKAKVSFTPYKLAA